MKRQRNEIRRLLVREAARLMYEEGIEQYLDAKRKAAKKILGKHTKELPSNGEISEELYRITKLHRGDEHDSALFQMRLIAMEVMEQLDEFYPRLIGSVSTGRIREGSDIDLHVFSDSVEHVQDRMEHLDWNYELKQIWIQKEGRPMEFTHIYLELEYPVELSIYPAKDIRIRGRSSTDSKPIERLSVSKVREQVLTEHAQAWQRYLET